MEKIPEVADTFPEITEAAASQAAQAGLRLYRDECGLTLEGDGMLLRADFSQMLPRLRQHNLQRELLVRACRVKVRDRDGQSVQPGQIDQPMQRPIRVLDATAGLGEDSLLLAAAGFQVTMYEQDPVIAALLGDALRRAEEHPALAGAVCRMQLIQGDSIAAMRELSVALPAHMTTEQSDIGQSTDLLSDGRDITACPIAPPDVIYLDPMFPERQKSGLIKKKFQLLQRLESPCADEEELLAAALAARPLRIVIKRPLKGPPLAGAKPGFVLKGKAIRYDCIVP